MECQILFTLYSTVVLDAIPCRCAQLHRCSATRGNVKKLFEVDGNGVCCWASNGRIGGRPMSYLRGSARLVVGSAELTVSVWLL